MGTQKEARMFRIGGKLLPKLDAALLCVEADRRHVVPRKVGSVTVPHHVPELVTVAGHTFSLHAAASIAEEADRLGVTPRKALVGVLEIYARRDSHRARTRATRKTPRGSWDMRRAAR